MILEKKKVKRPKFDEIRIIEEFAWFKTECMRNGKVVDVWFQKYWNVEVFGLPGSQWWPYTLCGFESRFTTKEEAENLVKTGWRSKKIRKKTKVKKSTSYPQLKAIKPLENFLAENE